MSTPTSIPTNTLPLCGYSTASMKQIGSGNPMGWAPRFAREGWVGVVMDWINRIAPHASGLFLSRADGACRTRVVGYRSDDKAVTTEVASADMMSAEDHRVRVPFVRSLVYSTRLVHYTGIPDDDEACIAIAVRRLRDLHVKEVGIDVSGQNLAPHCERFVNMLLDLGITVYDEPRCRNGLTPPAFAEKVRTASMPVRLLEDLDAGVPEGSIAIHNTNHPLTRDYRLIWQHKKVTPSVSRRQLLADAGVIDDGAGEVEGGPVSAAQAAEAA